MGSPTKRGDGRTLVQLRSRMTPDEYHRLRVHAVTAQREIADLVADALRAAYPLTPKEQSE